MSATAAKPTVHHGNNLLVKRLSRREKQEAVAKAVFGERATHQRVQRLEQQENIDDATLKLFAQYFGCTLEELRDTELTLDAVPMEITNNFNDTSNGSISGQNYLAQGNIVYNSEDVILKICQEKDRQIEQLVSTLNSILEKDRQEREELMRMLGKKV